MINENMNNAVKGFETTYSVARMYAQMIRVVFQTLLILQLMLWLFIFFEKLDSLESSVLIGFAKTFITERSSDAAPYRLTINGKNYDVPASMYYDYTTQYIWPHLAVQSKLLSSALWSLLIYLLGPPMVFYFKRIGKDYTNKKYVKGARLVSPAEFMRSLKHERTDLPFGQKLKLPVRFETQHCFVVGAPGSGKTVFLNAILKRLMIREESCITYDFKGDFIPLFYREGQDYIFNPMDERCLRWNVFNELKSFADIDAMAASLIPPGSKEHSFWTEAARDVFAGILIYLFISKKKTNKDIWEMVTMDTGSIAKCLLSVEGGKRGQIYIQDPRSRQALAVHSVLMQHTKCFQMLADIDGDFCISDWVRNPKGNIFIQNYANMSDTLRPLLSLFVDLCSRQILSLPDSIRRRLFLCLDELGTLQKMPSIIDLLTLGRSKGASVWLGIQDIGRIESIYGPELRQTIINACGNSVTLNVSDTTTAKYLSDKIGQGTYVVAQEGFSIGVKDSRDGQNILRSERTENIIMPSELQRLSNLQGYCKFIGSDITKIHLKYRYYPIINPALIQRSIFDLDKFFSKKDEGMASALSKQTSSQQGMKEKEMEMLEGAEKEEKREENQIELPGPDDEESAFIMGEAL